MTEIQKCPECGKPPACMETAAYCAIVRSEDMCWRGNDAVGTCEPPDHLQSERPLPVSVGKARMPLSAVVSLRNELERWKRGMQVEGDFICEDGTVVPDPHAEARELRDALLACLRTFYVGDGKVVCAPALHPHLVKFNALLRKYEPEIDRPEVQVEARSEARDIDPDAGHGAGDSFPGSDY